MAEMGCFLVPVKSLTCRYREMLPLLLSPQQTSRVKKNAPRWASRSVWGETHRPPARINDSALTASSAWPKAYFCLLEVAGIPSLGGGGRPPLPRAGPPRDPWLSQRYTDNSSPYRTHTHFASSKAP